MELISVIVPVYNVQKYLKKCVESILNQSYSNLEVILIDDGSTDESGQMCDKLRARDKRIKVFHQENKGLSAARNKGIELHTGRYLTFVDSDDYIAKSFIEDLYSIMIENDADLAMCLGQKFYEGEKPKKEVFEISLSEVYDSQNALESMLYRKKINSYAWGKLYKSELFNTVRFPEGVLFEDMCTLYKIYAISHKIVFNPARMYYYYQRRGSIVNSEFSKKKIEQIKISEDIIRFVHKNYPTIYNAAVSKCFIAAVDIYRRIPRGEEFAEEKQYAESIIKKYRKRVLRDSNNKKLTQVIACISMVNIKWLDWAGDFYQWLISKRILKIKNPI